MTVHTEQSRLQEIRNQNYLNDPTSKTVVIRGRKVMLKTYVKNEDLGTLEKVGRFLGGVAMAPLLLSKNFRDDTINPAIYGKAEEKMFVQIEPKKQDDKKLKKQLGYIPNDRATIRAYLKQPEIRAKLQSANGHLFLPEERRIGKDGISSFIFVPNGDFSKAQSKVICKGKTGGPVTNHEELLTDIRDYVAAHSDIEKGIDEAAEKIAKFMNKKKKEGEDGYVTVDMIKARMGPLLIDPANGEMRILPRTLGLNTDATSYRVGSKITVNEGTQKAWNRLHNSNLTEHKASLKGEKPFKPLPRDPEVDPKGKEEMEDEDGFFEANESEN